MNNDELLASLMPEAAALVMAVDEDDAHTIESVLTNLDTRALYGLVVLLAANVTADAPLRLEPAPAGEMSPHTIVAAAIHYAARAFDTTPTMIRGRSKLRNVTDARAVAMTVCRLAGFTSLFIGEEFGRDHTTVLYAASRCGENQRLWSAAKTIAARIGLERTSDGTESAIPVEHKEAS